MKISFYIFTACAIAAACSSKQAPQQNQNETMNETPATEQHPNQPAAVSPPRTTGSVERLDERIDDMIPQDAQPEILAEGFVWSEGPLWVEQLDALLFSDVPRNSIFKWDEAAGISLYLRPSGHTDPPAEIREPGSNGLALDAEGRLVMCQHGARQMARMDAPLDDPKPEFTPLATNYQGKKLNSPNDAVYSSSGNLYFTDPPYGLPTQTHTDPAMELDFQGVFMLPPNGELKLVTDKMSRPNGIALSPDEQTLYVANSDPGRPLWMAFDLDENGLPVNERVFFDAADLYRQTPGLPDGLKVDNRGNIYATGPGGVLVFSPEGDHLGTIKTGQPTANCAFNEDKSVLYITANMYLMRLKVQ